MKFKLLASSLLMSGVFALSGAVSVANANLLTIDTSHGGVAENIGDPGGTSYPTSPTTGASSGSGLPTALGGWPSSPNFAADPSFGGTLGIAGYDGSYLQLEHAGNVTFQFLGRGDAGDHDIFQLYVDNTWTTILDTWDNQSASNGTTGVSGSPTPSYNNSTPGSAFTTYITPDANGYIAFRFQNLTAQQIVSNDGSSNIHDNPNGPHFFLGVDPYTYAGGGNPTSGQAVFVGLTDRGFVTAGDHDYEDLVVRISVPEPGILALLMAGLLGFGVLRRRQAVSTSDAVSLLA